MFNTVKCYVNNCHNILFTDKFQGKQAVHAQTRQWLLNVINLLLVEATDTELIDKEPIHSMCFIISNVKRNISQLNTLTIARNVVNMAGQLFHHHKNRNPFPYRLKSGDIAKLYGSST